MGYLEGDVTPYDINEGNIARSQDIFLELMIIIYQV